MKQKLALFFVFLMLISLGGCKTEEKKSAAAAQTIVEEQAHVETDQMIENQQAESAPSGDSAKPPEKQEQQGQSTVKPGATKPSQAPDTPASNENQVPEQQKPQEQIKEEPGFEGPSEEESGATKPSQAPDTPASNENQVPEQQKPQEQIKEEPEIDYSTYIKVASYNIQNLAGGTKKDKVVEVLKAIDADIVGLQEVDVYTTRGGTNVNQAELLAKECGYPYWHFTKSIDYGGGSYGHAILSRYPIKGTTAVDFKVISSGDHHRNYGRHVIDINGIELVVYNTHMTLGSDKENGAEMTQVTSAMAKDQYAVLTGDMNMPPDNMGRYVNTKKVTVLNGGDEFVFYVNTFPQGNNPTSPIDNIVVTKTLDHYWSDDNNVGIEVVHTEGSDHNPIYTYIQFKE